MRAICGDDTALAVEVTALLAEDDAARDEPRPDPHIGQRLGPYQIDALVARGGMAAVYVAHRCDAVFDQRVAIKILDTCLTDAAQIARFRAERQILAALEHPAITRLLDGGVTPAGAPYLVMEFVDGMPIDRYADRHRLDVTARLRLFAAVCDGVSYAHRTLVLHRDLKPSNILVTADGRAKIVDFGTGTWLHPDRQTTVTRAPLTPAYASPEQLTGQAVGTASDQYSLGLVLYELLTGSPAFPHAHSLMASIERALTGACPPVRQMAVADAAAAVRQTSAARLRRHLARDLGVILQKAMAPVPAGRYASVQHLVDDLARWQAGDAILGRAPSVAYRGSRFVRRYWVAVSMVAVLLAGLATTTAVSLQQAARAGVQAQRAREESRRAQAESAKAQQLNTFLTQMLSMANPSWMTPSAVAAGNLSVQQMLDAAGRLIPVRLANAPVVEAEVRRTMGATYQGLGAFDEAHAHLMRALQLYTAQQDARGVAEVNALLGLAALQHGDPPEAERRLRAALAYVRAHQDTVDPAFHFSVVNDLGGALSHWQPGQAEARALLQEAVAVGVRHGVNAAGVGVALLHLGRDYLESGQEQEAEAMLRASSGLMGTLPYAAPERSSVLRTWSMLEYQRGRYAEAERLGAEAVEQGLRSRPAGHPLQASYLTAWGRALVASGHLQHGTDVLTDAYARYRRMRPANHVDLIEPLVGLGTAARLAGNLSQSEALLRQALAIAERDPARVDRTAEAARELRLTLRAAHRVAEAGMVTGGQE
ncbi:MAG: serine/threonine protein kinase [Acidobacteria bacterium]|nr:serine/threonine protein kinase [Acidobacteriota bacterium]